MLPSSSPGLGMYPRTSALRASSPSPCRALHPNESAYGSSRPSLKRQATAPMPSSSTVLMKKKRDTMTSSEDEQTPWSDDMHSAFLEALSKHPPTSIWKSDSSLMDISSDNQADYYKIIQDYILKKTGRPHSFEQISEHLSLAFPSPLATPITEAPHAEISSSFASPAAESSDAGPYSSYISQLHGEPIPYAKAYSLDPIEVNSNDTCASESPSMSRRRKACNRPTLNLQVDMPHVADSSWLSIEASLAFNCGSASSGLTPSTASFRPFTTPATLEDGLYPSTPAKQCHKGPLVPPEIPRIIDVRRNMAGRWIPTPTEGVLPSLSYASAISSPSSVSSFESFSDSSGSDSAQSNVTECMQSRPKMSKRAPSWLSIPRHVTSAHIDSSALASPIASLIGSSEAVSSSASAISDNQTFA